MKKFNLCIEEEVTVVKRTNILVDAETKEEAIKKMKEVGRKCGWVMELSDDKSVQFTDSEVLLDTIEPKPERKFCVWEEGSNEEEIFVER